MSYDITKVDVQKHPPSLEIITWYDHSTYLESYWRSFEDFTEMTLLQMASIGWVVYEDKQTVVLVSTVCKANQRGLGEVQIIKSAIINRWKLNDPTTPKPKRKANRKKAR
jgi:hypothetical protein